MSTAAPPQVTVIRKVRFAAAHFLALPECSDAENFRRFGPSSNTLAHGHNYEVSVHVSGPVAPETGMVVNLKDLKILLDEIVVAPLDFKNLNRQVPFFESRLTTLENLAQYIWIGLEPRITALSLHLSGLKIAESDDLYVEYFGGADRLSMNKQEETSGNQLFLTRKYEFPASHRLFNPDWSDAENARVFRQCNNPNGHGHNYELEVTVQGEPDPRMGMVVDIYALDEVVRERVLDRVDHKNLNLDVNFMQGLIPTAENIVCAIWRELAPHIPAPATLARLRLLETRNNFAEYHGE